MRYTERVSFFLGSGFLAIDAPWSRFAVDYLLQIWHIYCKSGAARLLVEDPIDEFYSDLLLACCLVTAVMLH